LIDEQQFCGVIKCVELETRRDIFLRQHKIAGVMALGQSDNGATRIVFDGGGHVDVCGAAEVWWREIELARLNSG
jgi:hypothetical protein